MDATSTGVGGGLLLPDDIGFPQPRPYTLSDGTHGASVDGAYLICVIEELVASSSTRVACHPHTVSAGFAEVLPDPVAERFRVLRRREIDAPLRHREALLDPVLREIGLMNPHPDDVRVSYLESLTGRLTPESSTAMGPLFELYSGVTDFFVGVQQRLAIDCPVDRLAELVSEVRTYCREPRNRLNLASLEGVLRAYETVDAPSLRLVPRASDELIETLRRLLEDEAYRELSASAARLGLPGRARQALAAMHRSVDKILRSRAFNPLLEVTSKAFTTATHIPVPSTGIIDRLVEPGFLPPIVDVIGPLEKATESWTSGKLDMIPFPHTGHRFRDA